MQGYLPDKLIGIAYHDGKLSTCTRTGSQMELSTHEGIADPIAAVPVVLDLLRAHKHDEPQYYIAPTPASAPLRDALDQATMNDSQVMPQVAQLTGPPFDPSRFADRWSELYFKMLEGIEANALVLPTEEQLTRELAEIQSDAQGTKYTAPAELQKLLGYYPTRAVAVIMASYKPFG